MANYELLLKDIISLSLDDIEKAVVRYNNEHHKKSCKDISDCMPILSDLYVNVFQLDSVSLLNDIALFKLESSHDVCFYMLGKIRAAAIRCKK